MTDDRPSLGTLVAGITTELGDLVQNQIELAKAEMRESAKAGAAAAALFIVAGVLSLVGLGTALATLPTGTAYAVWTATGASLTVAWAMLTGAESASVKKVLLLTGIVVSVVGLKVIS